MARLSARESVYTGLETYGELFHTHTHAHAHAHTRTHTRAHVPIMVTQHVGLGSRAKDVTQHLEVFVQMYQMEERTESV